MNSVFTLLLKRFKYRNAIYSEKQIIIVVHAAPKTQPSGVHGAFSNCMYQSPFGPLAINKEPIPNALKFMIKKMMNGFRNFIINGF